MRILAVILTALIGSGCQLSTPKPTTCPQGQVLVSTGGGWACTTLPALAGPTGVAGPSGATGATGAIGATGAPPIVPQKVTVMYQSATLYNATTLAAGADGTLVFSEQVHDPNGNYDPTTGFFKAPRSTVYLFSAYTVVKSVMGSVNGGYIELDVLPAGGGTYQALDNFFWANATVHCHGQGFMKLNQGDQVSFSLDNGGFGPIGLTSPDGRYGYMSITSVDGL